MPTSTVMTPEGLESLRKEIQELETVGRREIAERIKTAREWGDLKENAEYHDAKNDQALLETKIARLNETLRSAVAVEIQEESDVVTFGSTVEVHNEMTEKTASYTLVSSTEADAKAGRVSLDSPVGRALQGHRPGDVVSVQAPRGEIKLKILSLG